MASNDMHAQIAAMMKKYDSLQSLKAQEKSPILQQEHVRQQQMDAEEPARQAAWEAQWGKAVAPNVTIPSNLISSNPLQQIRNNFNEIGLRVRSLLGDKSVSQKLKSIDQARVDYAKQQPMQAANTPLGAFGLGAANDIGAGHIINALTGNNDYQTLTQAAQKKHPYAFTAGSVAGYVAPGAGMDTAISRIAAPLLTRLGTSVAADIARPVITGAISQGGLSALSDALSGQRGKTIAQNAGLNALTGGVLGGVGKAVGMIPAVQRAGERVSELMPKATAAVKNKVGIAATGKAAADDIAGAAKGVGEAASGGKAASISPDAVLKNRAGIAATGKAAVVDAADAAKGAAEKITPEKLIDTRKQITRLEQARDSFDSRYALTQDEKAIADDIAKGRRTADSLAPDARKETITQAAANRKALNENRQVLKDYNTARRKVADENMQDLLETSDIWKDKSKIGYGRETWDRNIEDIAGSKEGTRVRQAIFDPIHEHEAQRITYMNQGRNMVRDMKLGKKESEIVQMVGEGKLEPAQIPSGMDHDKIMNAVGTFRTWYNDTLDAVNKKLVQYGYEPVKYRKDYFPHFDGHDKLLDKLKSVFGIDLTNYDLPTEINGLTHTFKPGKQWVGNFLQRTGDKTTYDAVAGFDKYIDGVSRVLYHTDDIQNLRAFNRGIRYKYSDENIQKEYSKIMDSDLAQADKDKKIEDLFEKGPTHLSNAVADLEDFTQVLAGKKSLSDRSAENTFGRKIYAVANNIEQRISRNMVAINPGSWLTNFIPLTQATAGDDMTSVLRAMGDTLKGAIKDDGFVGKSTFLTNRVGSNPLQKGIIERATDIGARPMQWIDEFTSQVITRAKYYDEIKRGVDAATAMKDADRWAARAIGDRSVGSQPTIFNSKTPITKLFTQFQLETNNQLSFLFKDMPKDLAKQGAAKFSSAIVKMALFSYLYNEGYQALTGRRLAVDPIGMGLGVYNDTSGQRSPIQADYWLKGKTISKNTGSATEGNLNEVVANNIPFIAAPAGALGFDDIGRLPISGAIPNVGTIYGNIKKSGVGAGLKKSSSELLKPAYYIGMPLGGGQLKKTIEGVRAVNAGGEVAKTSGGDTVKFAVNKTPQNYLQAALFGKWSLPQAQNYLSDGGLSAKRTQAWQDTVSKGADNEKAFTALKSLSELEPLTGNKSVSTDQYIDAIRFMKDLTDDQKIAIGDTILTSDKARIKLREDLGR